MIILGKNKIDERFNISDDGVITDLNGNIQKTYLHQGRPAFKNVGVHQIQMWTKYEWKDGKIWHIHHKDENKLNNSLNNLVFLTHSEHAILHRKGKPSPNKGKKHPHSEETKKKISEAGKLYWEKKLNK